MRKILRMRRERRLHLRVDQTLSQRKPAHDAARMLAAEEEVIVRAVQALPAVYEHVIGPSEPSYLHIHPCQYEVDVAFAAVSAIQQSD